VRAKKRKKVKPGRRGREQAQVIKSSKDYGRVRQKKHQKRERTRRVVLGGGGGGEGKPGGWEGA